MAELLIVLAIIQNGIPNNNPPINLLNIKIIVRVILKDVILEC